MAITIPLTRRAFGPALAAGLAGLAGAASAQVRPAVTVHKDAACGCCTGWARHLERAGFRVRLVDVDDLVGLKARLGVPADLQSCHTAEIGGFLVEGHVPAAAVERLLAEAPAARGLAVPGMPVGSPGMEGGPPETYEVVLFGPAGRRTFARFRGTTVL
ncbi:DUF411 domain-containing protein [Rhodoplanes sp. TEM]|uniref:DUF411 domain-containing protein n=1 Tax=Rhodoplanes tepidamans TaxID=200616 RepID=A0ABT5J3E6_RHOTP|nr:MULTISPECIES: DUF411 domain-containing protein [Rhodoplanes]MDC7784098.1 DUF411 domain-containing protein [Rhodoplanes tepidamans]MDC7983193.1 DUF411 domain-containing protein [Rhodoplanes sp. TEM]MDQ0356805.1 hypothetical protein [Rhodoplanes tepidamans]